MGTTVIVVDTNQIRDSPLLRSGVWDELVAKAADWDLRFAIPEVCLREAVSVVGRKWTDKRERLEKIFLNEIGLDEKKILDEIDDKIAGYEDAFRARLAEIRADIVPIPAWVGMLDVVQRAVDKRAPYSEGEKDGFRDTLVWHTARSIADADADCEVWLVSNNYKDFGDRSEESEEACPHPLHPHLAAELADDKHSERLLYVRKLGRLKQHLAGTYDGLPPKEREAMVGGLNGDEFEALLWDEIIGQQLDNAAAGLPLTTSQGVLHWVTSAPESRVFVDAARRGGGVWTAQFKELIYANIALLDVDGNTSSIQKTLSVAGQMEAGTDGSVKELIVTSVEALPDDPMRRAYRNIRVDRTAVGQLGQAMSSSMRDYLVGRQSEFGPNMQEAIKGMHLAPVAHSPR